MIYLEGEMEKKYKEKFAKVKSLSEEFLKHQKEAMEMMASASRSMYNILEKVAEKEIERDPIGYIREESFIKETQGKMDRHQR